MADLVSVLGLAMYTAAVRGKVSMEEVEMLIRDMAQVFITTSVCPYLMITTPIGDGISYTSS